MGIPHFLAIPFPVQGQVNPVMQFCHVLSKLGYKVTFLHTEFSYKRWNRTISTEKDNSEINFVTFPDGLGPEDDRSDIMKVLFSMNNTMPDLFPKLIEEINGLDTENKISCMIVTMNMGWAIEVGHKLGIKGAFFFAASASSLASCYCIPKLIDDGIIDSNGIPTKKQEIQLAPNMPNMDTADLPWLSLGKTFFTNQLVPEMQIMMKFGEWWLCNSAYDLEPGAFSLSQRFLPIGPLMEIESNKSSFYEEDTTCLDWLDQHPSKSVIYVSFGSLAVMEPNQFNELALGLDLMNKPFLWVIRPGNDNNAYPNEFNGSKGKIVSWVPQKKVLNHPAIACFISHCGWNSTIEGLCSGVPFLCWPFFSDQFLDKSYICDVWKVGIGLEKDENGLIRKEEIEKKVDQVLGCDEIRARSLKLKEIAINNIQEGGKSLKNLEKFLNWAE
ncbi:hypothetical protein TanjilG_28878 [Lupinus angustifolius]|uniref:Glycosyltransferase n=1 Tax=Lupinus angustifolius TaxID=3871 RepID=A0A4P1R8W6_LUPAN|nr:PREDICTED: UDP-glycosyltransferase 83A1-like [Lupinus angustifolius]OIW05413.1 hypothetical protein TanjilG_28878 [Lupinus angustifolius]